MTATRAQAGELGAARASARGMTVALAPLAMKPTITITLLLAIVGCHARSSESPVDAGLATAPPLSDAGIDAPPTPASDAGPPDDFPSATPVSTKPVLLLPGTALYPRAVRLAVGAAAGTLVASVVAPQASGRMGGTILAATMTAVTFDVTGHIDDTLAAGGLCCATLFELPRPVAGLAAGTLLWAASVGGDTPAQPMSIRVWSSVDLGKTWTRLGTVVTAGVPRTRGGLWEPELSLTADGMLVCHYSDETDPAHSQKLVEARSSDGVVWGSFTNTVALATVGERPGMANVRLLPNGRYVMTYEICGVAGDNCTAHLRASPDGWSWGDADDPGLRPATVDGMHFEHAPTLVWSDRPGADGRLYLVGQMVYDGAGSVAPENGERRPRQHGGRRPAAGTKLPAPVPVAAPYDNFCPNYSSPLVPLDERLHRSSRSPRSGTATSAAPTSRAARCSGPATRRRARAVAATASSTS